MTVWLVEPRDPLIVREGRPFGPDPGAWATSLPFPFPSTLAGGVRTRSGLDDNGAFKYKNDEEQLKRLKEIGIRGPLLVQLEDKSDDIARDGWFVPLPHDVQFYPSEIPDAALLRRLVPRQLPTGAHSDFEQEGRDKHLQLVGHVDRTLRKPLSHKLRYWYWSKFQSWLIDPAQLESEEGVLLSTLGHKDLIRDQRLHVSMDSERAVGKEGLLFGTSGLEFTHPGEKGLHNAQRLALAVAVDEGNVASGVAGFAGERRIVTWRKSNAQLPTCHSDIEQSIRRDKHCRIVLLTPACFKEGYYPTWLCTEAAEQYGLKVDIQAIAVHRPQVVSGWDLEKGTPKSSRRLAPAGTVLFVSLQSGNDAALSQWIAEMWMQCISDDEQDRRDGFGLAVLGTWSGQSAEF